MRTTTLQNHGIQNRSSSNTGLDTRTKLSNLSVIVGRALFSFLFIAASFGHFKPETIAMAADQGVPFAGLLVPFSGLMAFAGGMSILLGFYARFGALLLILFLVPITFTMHNFWAVIDPGMAQMQMVMFMKNISLLGASLLIFNFGSGPLSLNHK